MIRENKTKKKVSLQNDKNSKKKKEKGLRFTIPSSLNSLKGSLKGLIWHEASCSRFLYIFRGIQASLT